MSSHLEPIPESRRRSDDARIRSFAISGVVHTVAFVVLVLFFSIPFSGVCPPRIAAGLNCTVMALCIYASLGSVVVYSFYRTVVHIVKKAD